MPNLPSSGARSNGPVFSEKTWAEALKTRAGRALLGHALSNGGAYIYGLNTSQSAKAANANRGAVAALNRATAGQLARVKSGSLTLTLRRSQAPSDLAASRYVKRIGHDRILNAIGYGALQHMLKATAAE